MNPQENFSAKTVNDLFKTIAKSMRITDEYIHSPYRKRPKKDHKKELEYEDQINF